MTGIAKSVTIKILQEEENAIDVNLRKQLIVNWATALNHLQNLSNKNQHKTAA